MTEEMHTTILRALDGFGLSKREAKVYLTLLETGEIPVAEIARKSETPRELTYVVLDKLNSKGLATQRTKNHKKFFTAANPDILIYMFEEKKTALLNALKKMQALQKKCTHHHPECKVFEGVEGLKSALNHILLFYETYRGEKILYGYGSAGEFERFLKWSFPHFVNRRSSANIMYKAIYDKIAKGKQKKRLPKSEILISSLVSAHSSFYMLYPNHVVIFIFADVPIVVNISSKDHYLFQKKHFEKMWEWQRELEKPS